MPRMCAAAAEKLILTRADQIALLNRVANTPEVLRWVAPGFDHIDLSAFFDRPGNVMLGNDAGVVLFGAMGEGFYSAHFLFTKALRGRDALLALRMAFTSLFTLTDAVAITGLIPRENRASRAIARALGCRPLGSAKDALGRCCNSYLMERGTWVTLSADLSAASDRCLVAAPPRKTTSRATTT